MAAVIGGIVIGNISGISIYLGDIGLKVLAVIILGGLDSIGTDLHGLLLVQSSYSISLPITYISFRYRVSGVSELRCYILKPEH